LPKNLRVGAAFARGPRLAGSRRADLA